MTRPILLQNCTRHTRSAQSPMRIEDDCQDAFNKCRSAPGANISTCVSEKSACDEKGTSRVVSIVIASVLLPVIFGICLLDVLHVLKNLDSV
jgi:hypothetical protein